MKKTRPFKWRPVLDKRVRVSVTALDIKWAKGCDPNKCMIKVATARAINVPHGYIRVDSTGVAVTRRNDFREKAFLPRVAVKAMLMFDDETTRDLVKPFSFWLEFHKTSRVHKASAERKEAINAARRARVAAGNPDRRYTLTKRIKGIAITQELAEEIDA